MNKTFPLLIGFFLLNLNTIFCQSMEPDLSANYWELSANDGIVWHLQRETRLPHSDNIEMAGRKVASIIYYSIDENKQLSLKRDIIFPQLRTYIKTTDPDWKRYRAYFRHTYSDEMLPAIAQGGKIIEPGPVDSVTIKGKLEFYHHPVAGIRITRTLFPSMRDRVFLEKWEVENITDENTSLQIGNVSSEYQMPGVKGIYTRKVYSDANDNVTLPAHSAYTFGVYFSARINNEPIDHFNLKQIESQRDDFLNHMRQNLVLKTPDPMLNTLFYFSKIRASESIFDSKMGLVHSPGGGNYYVGVWANDQVEYSGPFFPFLGYEDGNTAALNAYKMFMKNIPEDSTKIWSSFEMEGDLPCCSKDRGDAAMIAYGTSQFALARGDKEIAQELWPLIEWSLEYCHKKQNDRGAVRSDTDEMEGRISTGDANLSTSSLYYGGLKFASRLADELGETEDAKKYRERAEQMASTIENYFGAEIEGLKTYRYFDGNQHLRHWICLPLVMGIEKRKEGTIDALFNKLWTKNGVLVEYNPESDKPNVFWDRGTLYALRGALKAGATEIAMKRLSAFSEKRLLGEHVPYVIEAYPENNMRHLSAESALYCHIFIEGLLGIEQTGFKSFTFTPDLPDAWEFLDLNEIRAFDENFSVKLKRAKNKIQVVVYQEGKIIYNKKVQFGDKISINL